MRSPCLTPSACKPDDQRSHRSRNCSYVKRSSPSTTASRVAYRRRARRANSSGVRGISRLLPSLLRDYVLEILIIARWVFPERRVRIGVETNHAWIPYPRLLQHLRIFDDYFVCNRVADSREFFNHVQLVAVEIPRPPEPG